MSTIHDTHLSELFDKWYVWNKIYFIVFWIAWHVLHNILIWAYDMNTTYMYYALYVSLKCILRTQEAKRRTRNWYLWGKCRHCHSTGAFLQWIVKVHVFTMLIRKWLTEKELNKNIYASKHETKLMLVHIFVICLFF